MLKKEIAKIVSKTVDLHLHIGPEFIPRKYNVKSLIEEESGKIKGCVLKNHFYNTSNLFGVLERKKMKLYGGIVLNNFIGGLNADAIYGASLIAPSPLFVWFPTLHTKQFLNNSVNEIPQEWVNNKKFIARKSSKIKPIFIIKNGKLNKDVISVIEMIKKTNSVLCTGHISWQESVLVVTEAKKQGVKKIIITHPIYQKIDMPLDIQKELVKKGCFIEHCYSMHSIDKISIKRIVEQIRFVGSNGIIISSDVGQIFSISPSKALFKFAMLLFKEGISLKNLQLMMNSNIDFILS